MSSHPEPDALLPEAVTIDARGLRCPIPVIRLARAMAAPDVERVVVLATDPAARADIPAWCRMRGQHLAGVTERDDHIEFEIHRPPSQAPDLSPST